MISERNEGITNLVLLCQCILATVGFWIWFLLWYYLPIDRDVVNCYVIYNGFVLLGLLVDSRHSIPVVGLHISNLEETSRRTFQQLGSTLFYLLLYIVAAHDARISRLFFFSYIPLLYVILFASNRFLPSFLGWLALRRGTEQKVLLVGPRKKALEIKRWLDQHRHLGLKVIGLLSESSQENKNDELQTLGRPEDLPRFLVAPGAVQVIMVEFPLGEGCLRYYTSLCEERGIRLLVVADLHQIFGHPVTVFEDRKRYFLGLREEALQDPINRAMKRCVDIAVAAPVVVFILPPLMLMIWICQHLQSPGPLFFVQSREGLHNEPFKILKFRTMHAGNARTEKLPTSREDPRLYPVGSLLRKYSLDEMPQFLNVLRGDMSVVGPRPHLTCYNQQYRQVFLRAYVRSFVKPGITGLAQVRGFRGTAESSEDVVHRMESDIEYLENWSGWLDCWLILRTAGHVFFPPKTAV